MLVDLPARHLEKPVSELRAYRSHDYKCEVKAVFRTEDTLTALVDTREVERDTAFYVYALTGGEPIAAAPADAPPLDPRPLRATAYRTHGQEMPDSVPGFRLMARHRDTRNMQTADCANFDDIMSRTVHALNRSWSHHMVALEIASWIVVPEAGNYQFRLRNGGAAFMLVNGSAVARKPDLPGDGQWVTGESVALPPGIHRVEIFTGSKRHFAAPEFGWRRAERNSDERAPGILLVTAGARAGGRLEIRDETEGLFASASIEIGEPYCFDPGSAGMPGNENPPVFYPATLKATLANWGGGAVHYTWRDEERGIELGDQPRQRILLASTGSVVRATLEARRADGQTATARAEARVTGTATRALVVESYLEGAPAFAFPGDEARPEIHLRASSHDRMPFDIEAVFRSDSGTNTLRGRVHTERTWARLELGAVKIGPPLSIEWTVYHAGEIVHRGLWNFIGADTVGAAACPNPCPSTRRPGPAHVLGRPPAPPCPNPTALHVLGDRLTRGGAGVTLVARRATWQGPAFATQNTGKPVVFLDGSETPAPGWFALRDLGDAEGSAELRPFAGVASLPKNLRVVVVPPRPELHENWRRDHHTRRLSALCGLLKGAGHDVVIVAMPGRVHAETAFRIADAWGIGIADAHSDFMAGAPENPAARIEELARQAFGEGK